MVYNFKNTVIFPYGYEFLSIISGLNKRNLLDSSVKLISPEGWGISGKDAGNAYGRPDLGIEVSDNIKNAIFESEAFVAVPFKYTEDEKTNNLVNKLIDEGIKFAKSLGKNIIDMRNIEAHKIPDEIGIKDFDIDCPIVFINGISEQLNKLDILIDISDSLSVKGYKVAQIGTRPYCNLLGMHSFPQFMFDTINERKKIKAFQSYIYNIYKEEKPDIMIIGIPGAAIPFNDKVDNGYGIIHYLISMAIKADFSITCSNLGTWDFEKLNLHFTHRFGHGINCVVLTNTKLNYNPLDFPDKIFYEILDYQMINTFINKVQEKSPNIPIFNEFSKKDIEALANLIISKFSNVEYFKV